MLQSFLLLFGFELSHICTGLGQNPSDYDELTRAVCQIEQGFDRISAPATFFQVVTRTHYQYAYTAGQYRSTAHGTGFESGIERQI